MNERKFSIFKKQCKQTFLDRDSNRWQVRRCIGITSLNQWRVELSSASALLLSDLINCSWKSQTIIEMKQSTLSNALDVLL